MLGNRIKNSLIPVSAEPMEGTSGKGYGVATRGIPSKIKNLANVECLGETEKIAERQPYVSMGNPYQIDLHGEVASMLLHLGRKI